NRPCDTHRHLYGHNHRWRINRPTVSSEEAFEMNGYLQDTLHGILNCKCSGNCILKSLYVDEVKNGKAYITAEPYDDAFRQNQIEETIQKIKRIMWKRKKSIWQALDVYTVK